MIIRILLRLRRHARKLSAIAILAIIPSPATAYAQSVPPAPAPESPAAHTTPLTFEVASIRPSDKPGINPWRDQPTPDGISEMNVSLQYLMRNAYGVFDDKRWSGGPAWLNTQRFDVEAKFDATTAPNPTLNQRRLAMQALLADRFKLKVHHEVKEFPAYNLVVAKTGPKFQQTAPGNDNDSNGASGYCHHLSSQAGEMKLQSCSMAQLANVLRPGRTVVDKTGLTARYDFDLRWTPDEIAPGDTTEYTGPSIFTAVQEQLGLKLEPATEPLDVIVIDSAEMPTGN